MPLSPVISTGTSQVAKRRTWSKISSMAGLLPTMNTGGEPDTASPAAGAASSARFAGAGFVEARLVEARLVEDCPQRRSAPSNCMTVRLLIEAPLPIFSCAAAHRPPSDNRSSPANPALVKRGFRSVARRDALAWPGPRTARRVPDRNDHVQAPFAVTRVARCKDRANIF